MSGCGCVSLCVSAAAARGATHTLRGGGGGAEYEEEDGEVHGEKRYLGEGRARSLTYSVLFFFLRRRRFFSVSWRRGGGLRCFPLAPGTSLALPAEFLLRCYPCRCCLPPPCTLDAKPPTPAPVIVCHVLLVFCCLRLASLFSPSPHIPPSPRDFTRTHTSMQKGSSSLWIVQQ